MTGIGDLMVTRALLCGRKRAPCVSGTREAVSTGGEFQMKRMVYATVLAAAILIAAYTGTARAQFIPPGINHQGLVKVNGAPYTGSGSFYFALSLPDGLGGFSNVWTSDGSQMHTSNRPSSPITLSVNEGHYNVALGDGSATNSMDYTIFKSSGGQLWLRIWFNDGVNGIQKLSPDQPLSSVPYAFAAQGLMSGGTGSGVDADLLDGQHATAFAVGSHTHAASAITSGFLEEDRIPSGIARLYQIIYQVKEDDGAGSGVDADLLDGLHAASFAASSHTHGAAEILPTILGADGAGSGLDADLLDGKQANQLWSTTGNNSTTPGTNFVGTTDNIALEIKVNNTRAMRIEPTIYSPNLIGGYTGNSVTAGAKGATISGGGASGENINTITDDYGTIGGGRYNQAGNGTDQTNYQPYATVGGGYKNTASGDAATVGGGNGNTSSGTGSTVSGGQNNTSDYSLSTVGGGYGNTANNNFATVVGGASNTASGNYSVVAGGSTNTAQGNYRFAAGTRAQANHKGAFVWGDSTEADVVSSANNQFTARAAGGVRFYSNAGLTTGVQLAAGGGSWTAVSDRNQKENIAPVDCGEVLDKVAELPVCTWNYTSQESSIRHMGPMAQDLYAAFGLGESDTGITTIDADGVALAAIQGLNKRLKEKEARIVKLEAELEEMKSMVKQLASR